MTMKLTPEEAVSFYSIISTACQGGIEQLVFQDEKIGVASGMREGSCAIIVRSNVPRFPQKMGVTRLSTLKKRMDLLVGQPGFQMSVKESERGEIVQIELQAGKTKTQYRCTASVGIQAPADVSDGGVLGILTISKEELSMILNGAKAMGATQIIMIVKADGTVSFELSDANDRFNVELEKSIERVDEEADSAVFYYETGIFSTLLRTSLGSSEMINIAVGVSGTIQFDLNECEMSIFAQIEGANA
jgi:hypothetical protein